MVGKIKPISPRSCAASASRGRSQRPSLTSNASASAIWSCGARATKKRVSKRRANSPLGVIQFEK